MNSKRNLNNRSSLIVADVDAEIDERKWEIVTAAAELFVKQGYHKTTVRQIATKAGLSMGGLYHHVHSKDSILSLVLDSSQLKKSEFTELVKSSLTHMSATQAIRYAIEQHILIVNAMQDIYLFFFQEGKYLRREDLKIVLQGDTEWINAYRLVLEKGCASGEFNIKDISIAAANISYLCDMWAVKRWFFRNSYNMKQYIREQQNFILSAITNIVSDTSTSVSSL